MYTKYLIKGLSNLLPLLGPLLGYDLEELLVLFLLPLGLSDQTLVALVPLVLALCVISARDQFGHVLPVRGVKVLRLNRSLSAVGVQGPIQQLRLVFIPVPLCRVLSLKVSQKIRRSTSCCFERLTFGKSRRRHR